MKAKPGIFGMYLRDKLVYLYGTIDIRKAIYQVRCLLKGGKFHNKEVQELYDMYGLEFRVINYLGSYVDVEEELMRIAISLCPLITRKEGKSRGKPGKRRSKEHIEKMKVKRQGRKPHTEKLTEEAILRKSITHALNAVGVHRAWGKRYSAKFIFDKKVIFYKVVKTFEEAKALRDQAVKDFFNTKEMKDRVKRLLGSEEYIDIYDTVNAL